MRKHLIGMTIVAVALAGAGPAWAQGQPAPAAAKGGIPWNPATPELPKKREEGKAAEGPVEGPEHPQLRELPDMLRKGYAVLLYWWWPDASGPGKACAVIQEKVFDEAEVPAAIQKGEYVCLRVNGKTCPPEVIKEYRVGSFPTLQLWTCDGKVAKSFSGPYRDAGGFVAALLAIGKRNDALRRARAELRKKVEKELDRINALKDGGKLDEARKAYERLAKKHAGTDIEDDCKWGLRECRMIEIAAEGEALFKAGKYIEARGRLAVVADFEVPCPARDTARKLLAECEVGAKIQEAEQCAKEGKMLEAMEKLQAVVNDQWYDGPMKQVAKDKIAELKEQWGNK